LDNGDQNWGASDVDGNLPSPQSVKDPEANISSQYTKKESFYNESSPEAEYQLFYKRLQVVYFYLSIAGVQAQCPEDMCTEPYPQSNGDNQQLIPAINCPAEHKTFQLQDYR
jgi:hypothetical protein